MKIVELEGDLAAVNLEIKNAQTKWKNSTAVINKLTNYKRTPVKEGSRAYYQCVAAAKAINSDESV